MDLTPARKRPSLPDGTPMKNFEVRMFHKDGALRKAVFIDGELLDWSVDTATLHDAMTMGEKFFRAVQRDIEAHVVASVSDFVGRKVTAQVDGFHRGMVVA